MRWPRWRRALRPVCSQVGHSWVPDDPEEFERYGTPCFVHCERCDEPGVFTGDR